MSHPNRHFWHRGETGDIIYAWFFIKHLGGARLSVPAKTDRGANLGKALEPLAALQPYLRFVPRADQPPPSEAECLRIAIDCGKYSDPPNIIRPYFNAHLQPWPGYVPWIAGVEPIQGDYTVVNVTSRYRDPQHRWGEFLPAGELRFLGTGQEYDEFQRHLCDTGYHDAAARTRYIWTPDFLEAARHIAGARAFYGNASACLAIAQGIGHSHLFVEVGSGTDRTCLFGHETILNGAHVNP